MQHRSRRIGSARRIIAAISALSLLVVLVWFARPQILASSGDPDTGSLTGSGQSPPKQKNRTDGQTRTEPSKSVHSAESPALKAFLERFDEIKARGFIRTMRSGSTGVGYTLETLLDLKENNDRRGDFLGMEIKAYRDDESELNDSDKMNLFLKEPKWLDGMRSADRIREYGYIDDNGRTALYSTVTATKNSHGFAFEVDDDASQLFLLFDGDRVAFWTFDVLQQRLIEKHTQSVFVAAESRGTGSDEEFRYHSVTWCSQPSVAAFVELIRKREVVLELRMHVKENGSARNHGSAFRIRKNRIRQLYATVRKCR